MSSNDVIISPVLTKKSSVKKWDYSCVTKKFPWKIVIFILIVLRASVVA